MDNVSLDSGMHVERSNWLLDAPVAALHALPGHQDHEQQIFNAVDAGRRGSSIQNNVHVEDLLGGEGGGNVMRAHEMALQLLQVGDERRHASRPRPHQAEEINGGVQKADEDEGLGVDLQPAQPPYLYTRHVR